RHTFVLCFALLLAAPVPRVLEGVSGPVVVVKAVVVVTTIVVVVARAPTRRAPSAASRTTRLRCASDGKQQEQGPCPHHEGSAWASGRKPARDLTGSGAAACSPLPMELTRFST